jgi:hypothetical protein
MWRVKIKQNMPCERLYLGLAGRGVRWYLQHLVPRLLGGNAFYPLVRIGFSGETYAFPRRAREREVTRRMLQAT